MTEIDISSEPDVKPKAGSTEIQDGSAEFEADGIESEMRDVVFVCHPLKRKARTGRQGSQGRCMNVDWHFHV